MFVIPGFVAPEGGGGGFGLLAPDAFGGGAGFLPPTKSVTMLIGSVLIAIFDADHITYQEAVS